MIEFDVETKHLQTAYDDGAGLFLTQFYAPEIPGLDTPSVLPVYDPALREVIQRNLSLGVDYRAWNSKFDLHALRGAGFELPDDSLWHDGMVQAHLMDERSSVALKVRGERLFGPSASDAQEKVHAWLKDEDKRRRAESKQTGAEFVRANFSDVPDEIMRPYAAGDVVLTRQIGDTYEPAFESSPELQALYDIERANLVASFWMEDRGIAVDRAALVAQEAHLHPLLDAQEETCRRIADFKNFNPRSPKQISEALDRLGADTRFMSRSGKSGWLVTDEENLAACDHPLAREILRYRGIHKMWAMIRAMLHGPPGADGEKFPHPYVSPDDRLHPNFRQTGARTGRYSCSNPNFQQVPRDNLDLRYAITASEGNKLVCCDLDSIELRLLVAFAGAGAMRDTIARGDDPHERTAAMAGLSGRSRSDGTTESARDQGKKMNYLQVYGGGTTAIRKWFHVSASEAREIQKRYRRAYPEVDALTMRIDAALSREGYVKTPFGRRQRAWSKRDAYKESYKFVNYLIQGTAADMMKIAIRRVHEAGVPLVATVHDELIADVPEADAAEAAHVIQEAMTDFPEIEGKVPVTAEAQVVDRWSDAKTKPGAPNHIPEYIQED